MRQVAEALERSAAAGRRAAVGRVVELQGFSTLPVDEMVVIDEDGGFYGDLLGRPGQEKLSAAAGGLIREGRMATVPVEIRGPLVRELGLSCGGRADVLVQPAQCIPGEFWSALTDRAPVALATVVEGPAAGPGAVAFDRTGRRFGSLPVAGAVLDGLAAEAVVLLEGWVPHPRLVVVGTGDVARALDAQAGLLGWEARATDVASVEDMDELLDWAGATAAVVVLSHDPHVDTPALAAALGRATPYVGAMGSRRTQSRRLDRLAAQGVPDEQLDRIHRPIGLDLGGRRAPEVALSIVGEILAYHCGRGGGSLRDRTGPIHG